MGKKNLKKFDQEDIEIKILIRYLKLIKEIRTNKKSINNTIDTIDDIENLAGSKAKLKDIWIFFKMYQDIPLNLYMS